MGRSRILPAFAQGFGEKIPALLSHPGILRASTGSDINAENVFNCLWQIEKYFTNISSRILDTAEEPVQNHRLRG
jgi:hypothetical protein